jgi:hypothetical protein
MSERLAEAIAEEIKEAISEALSERKVSADDIEGLDEVLDAYDFDDKIENWIDGSDFEISADRIDGFDRAVDSVLEDYNFNDQVSEAIENYDFEDEFDKYFRRNPVEVDADGVKDLDDFVERHVDSQLAGQLPDAVSIATKEYLQTPEGQAVLRAAALSLLKEVALAPVASLVNLWGRLSASLRNLWVR